LEVVNHPHRGGSTETHEEVLSVGGAGGIQVTSKHVQVNQAGVMNAPQAQPLVQPTMASMAGTNDQAMMIVTKYGGLMALGAVGVGLVVAGVGAGLILMLSLPLILISVPVAASLVMFVAALVLRKQQRAAEQRIPQTLEAQLLDHAAASAGRVTAVTAARALAVPIKEASEALDKLAQSGHVDIDNDIDTGVIVYVFPDFASKTISS
jgi:hypothetical protein